MNYTKRHELRRYVERNRQIKAPLHSLTPGQRAELEATLVEEFFSPPFLERALGDEYSRCRSLPASAPNIAQCVKATWPDAKTLGDVVKLPLLCVTLTELSGFGSSALLLLIESLTAFDYEVKYEPTGSSAGESEAQRKARELAEKLGI